MPTISLPYSLSGQSALDVTKLMANLTTLRDGVNNAVPLGTILDWFPPSSATGPSWNAPQGFAVCDGTAWSSITNDLGYTTGNIPNLVGKVTIGAQASLSKGTAATHNTTTGIQTNPGINGEAGVNSVAPHSHSIPDHTHNLKSHTHAGPSHRHSLSYKSPDLVYLVTGNGITQYTTTVSTLTDANTGYDGTGATGGPSDNTSDGMNSRASTGTTGENSYEDNRPISVGVLKIMKVLL